MYTGLYVAFDRGTEIGGIRATQSPIKLNCSGVFSFETTAMLGTGAQCEWRNTQQREISIRLSPLSSVLPGKILTLLGGNVRTRNANYSRRAYGNISITNNFPQLMPLAVIEAPQSATPLCGYLEIHRVVGMPHYSTTGTLMLEKALIYQNMFLHTGFSSQISVSIDTDFLLPDTEYTVTLTVRNVFGREALQFHSVTVKISQSTALLIKGGSAQKVCAHKEIFLETVVIICSNVTTPITYQWRIRDGNNIVILNITTTISSLTIPPHTLLRNQEYLAEVLEHESVNVLAVLEPCLTSIIL